MHLIRGNLHVYTEILLSSVWMFKGTYSCCVEKCCPEGRGSMSVSFVVLWKQEKRLCFWIAVLALYERFLAHSQVSAPSEGRLMTASHGKAESRGKQRKAIGWEGKDRRDGGVKQKVTAVMLLMVAGMSKRCVTLWVFVPGCASVRVQY